MTEINHNHPLCALCERPIPPDAQQSLHHLVPKLKGGKKGPTVLLHQICHNEIHSCLSEAELAKEFNSPEKLKSHPHLAKFITWISKKDPSFSARTQPSLRRKRKR